MFLAGANDFASCASIGSRLAILSIAITNGAPNRFLIVETTIHLSIRSSKLLCFVSIIWVGQFWNSPPAGGPNASGIWILQQNGAQWIALHIDLRIRRTECPVCTLIQILLAALIVLSGTFPCDSCLIAFAPWLITLSLLQSNLFQRVGVGYIFHGTEFHLISSLFAWHFMQSIDWKCVSSIPEIQFLPYNIVCGYVRGFTSPFKARVVISDRDTYIGLPKISRTPLTRNLPAWLSWRESR